MSTVPITDSPTGAGKLGPYPKYKSSAIQWIGRIPQDWEEGPLKRTFRIFNGATPKSTQESYWDGDIPWVTPEDLGTLTGDTIAKTSRQITKSGYKSCGTQLVPAGSLILSTRAPIGHLAIAGVALCTNQGCRSLVFRGEGDIRYFYYELLSARKELQSWGQGSTFMELASAKLGAIQCVQPPLREQRAIVAFLDRETSRIDALISKRQQLIELLEEKRAALISRAVTKELKADAALEDSGVEWIGSVPTHWNLHRLRRVIQKFVDYRGATPQKATDGIPLVTARNIKNGIIDMRLSEEFIREEDYDDWMVRGTPEIGDVLLTTEAPLGESAQVVDPKIALAQRIILLKRNKDMVTNDYLKHYFLSKAGRGELWSRATGSTALGIKASHLKEITVTVPPLDEQRDITCYLDQRMTGIDELIRKMTETIEKHKEYQAALISAAVTGKIDVRKEVPND